MAVKKMMSKVIAFICVFALVVGNIQLQVAKAQDEVTVNGFDELEDAISNGETIIRFADDLSDLTLDNTLMINNDVKFVSTYGIILCVESGRHFDVQGNNVTLEFENVTLDGQRINGGIEASGGLTLIGADIRNCYHGIFDSVGGGLYAGGTLELLNCNFENNFATLKGGAVYTQGNTQITNSWFTNNKSNNSGGGVYAENCELNLDKVIMEENIAYQGCALYVNATTLTIENSPINNNGPAVPDIYFGRVGGGIYATTNSNVILAAGTTVNNNRALYGGGVCVWIDSSITINEGAQVNGNTATDDGGGIYNALDSTVTLNRGEISGNKAGNGGGVFSYTSKLFLNSGSINENYAAKNGAGVGAVIGSMIEQNGGTINENDTSDDGGAGYGGGVYLSDREIYTTEGFVPSTLTQNGGQINGNTSVRAGGVFAGNGSTVMQDGGQINGNQTTSGMGGGVFITGGSSLHQISGEINNNSSIYANPFEGGGVSVIGSTLIQEGGTINGNRGGVGGGVYADKDYSLNLESKITQSGGQINKNEAYKGGGLMILSGSVMDKSGGQINENSSSSTITGASGWLGGEGGGGIIASSGSTINMTGGEINNNTAACYGGGVFTNSSSVLNLSGGEINSNTAEVSGGGVFAGGAFTMTDGEINSNTASANGGGVYTIGIFTMLNGKISSNTTTGWAHGGGGVYTETDTFLSGGVISNNKSLTSGGGVFSNGDVEIDGCEIDSNEAGYGTGNGIKGNGQGGGIYAVGSVILNDGSVSENRTESSHGGGLFVGGELNISGGQINDNYGVHGGAAYIIGAVSMNGGEVSGNSSSYDGGGLYTETGMTMNNGTVSNNYAPHSGGGILAYSNSGVKTFFTMTGGIISGNEAAYGAGVSVAGDCEILAGDYDIPEISDNHAIITANGSGYGGGIVAFGDIKVAAGIFTNNSANIDGGALYLTGVLSLYGGEFTGNTAGNDGGAVYCFTEDGNNSTADILGPVTFKNNAAGQNGGGIYNSNPNLVNIGKSVDPGVVIFEDNSSSVLVDAPTEEDIIGHHMSYLDYANINDQMQLFNNYDIYYFYPKADVTIIWVGNKADGSTVELDTLIVKKNVGINFTGKVDLAVIDSYLWEFIGDTSDMEVTIKVDEDEDNNIIYFYYNEIQRSKVIVKWIGNNADGTDTVLAEQEFSDELVGIDFTASADWETIDSYLWSLSSLDSLTITIDADADYNVICFYYDEIQRSKVIVKWIGNYADGTDTVLAEQEFSDELVGTDFTASADWETIDSYLWSLSSLDSLTITIDADADYNVICFYYDEIQRSKVIVKWIGNYADGTDTVLAEQEFSDELVGTDFTALVDWETIDANVWSFISDDSITITIDTDGLNNIICFYYNEIPVEQAKSSVTIKWIGTRLDGTEVTLATQEYSSQVIGSNFTALASLAYINNSEWSIISDSFSSIIVDADADNNVIIFYYNENPAEGVNVSVTVQWIGTGLDGSVTVLAAREYTALAGSSFTAYASWVSIDASLWTLSSSNSITISASETGENIIVFNYDEIENPEEPEIMPITVNWILIYQNGQQYTYASSVYSAELGSSYTAYSYWVTAPYGYQLIGFTSSSIVVGETNIINFYFSEVDEEGNNYFDEDDIISNEGGSGNGSSGNNSSDGVDVTVNNPLGEVDVDNGQTSDNQANGNQTNGNQTDGTIDVDIDNALGGIDLSGQSTKGNSVDSTKAEDSISVDIDNALGSGDVIKTNPKTGDYSNPYIITLSGIIALMGILLIARKKKNI